ncbi:MAG: hypothetical protein J5979_02180 [Lachnospiraceae bacterium]|nr:hypothetical protein [Lachnospiraceae bacterium]
MVSQKKGLKMEIAELVQMNQINPMERFFFIVQKDLKELSLDILMGLFTIDQVIKDNTNIHYYYYIQDDRSILFFLKNTLYEKLEYNIFSEALFYLDYAKLIYRFTCAKKFCVEDDLINQLRINSWGREFILQYDILNENRIRYEKMYNYFNSYYMQHEDLYKKLLNLLVQPMTLDNVHLIKRVNEELSIQLLS